MKAILVMLNITFYFSFVQSGFCEFFIRNVLIKTGLHFKSVTQFLNENKEHSGIIDKELVIYLEKQATLKTNKHVMNELIATTTCIEDIVFSQFSDKLKVTFYT